MSVLTPKEFQTLLEFEEKNRKYPITHINYVCDGFDCAECVFHSTGCALANRFNYKPLSSDRKEYKQKIWELVDSHRELTQRTQSLNDLLEEA